jgi:hypothetical protein
MVFHIKNCGLAKEYNGVYCCCRPQFPSGASVAGSCDDRPKNGASEPGLDIKQAPVKVMLLKTTVQKISKFQNFEYVTFYNYYRTSQKLTSLKISAFNLL